jgi:hypothetical protein
MGLEFKLSVTLTKNLITFILIKIMFNLSID